MLHILIGTMTGKRMQWCAFVPTLKESVTSNRLAWRQDEVSHNTSTFQLLHFSVIIHTHVHTGNMDGLTRKTATVWQERCSKEGCLDKRQTRCLEVKSLVLKHANHLHNCYGTEPTLLGEITASISSWSLAEPLQSGGSIFQEVWQVFLCL